MQAHYHKPTEISSYNNEQTLTLEYNKDGLEIHTTGINTITTGTVGNTTIGIDQPLSLNLKEENQMEIIQGTSILFGVTVGVIILLIALKVDKWLNQRYQADYDEKIKETKSNK